MRNRYLVAYDVSDPKRLRQTHKKMTGFGDPVQYSVFICELSSKERVLLEEALTAIIHHQEDQILIVNLGPIDGRGSASLKALGRQVLPAQREVVIV